MQTSLTSGKLDMYPEYTGVIVTHVLAVTNVTADVFSTDPPLGKGSKYTVLADPKHVTGFQNVAPIVKTSVAAALGSKFTTTVNAVSATLPRNAIVAMNKAVIMNKQDPAKVAKAFLNANHLI